MNTFFIQLTKVIFLIGLLLFSEQISAQRTPRPTRPSGTRPSGAHRPNAQPIVKSYKIAEILIMKPGEINKGIACGDPIEKLVNLLGNPSKIEEYYNEMQLSNEKLYYYNKNKIYVRNGKVVSYELLDNSIAFGKLNAFQIKVGDNMGYRTIAGGRRGALHIKDFEPIFRNTNREKVRNLENDFEFVCNDLRTNNNVRVDLFFSVLFLRNKVISIYFGD